MSREEIFNKLNEIFAEVFDNDELEVTDETTAADVDGWDSLSHIVLISEVEEAFGIHFPMKYVLSMKNVGEMVSIIKSMI